LYHNKEYDEAYALEKKAVENFDRKDVSMNEAFAVLTEKIKGQKAAQEELEKFFEEGKYSPKMKEQLKAIYLAQNNSEDQWIKYAGGLEQMAFNKLKAELAKKMINMPAPDFKLKDLTGKEVALSSLKGKVVVVLLRSLVCKKRWKNIRAILMWFFYLLIHGKPVMTGRKK
jgi:hypothetical protein